MFNGNNGVKTDHENITRLRHLAPLPKNFEHIPELPMNVAANRDGGLDEVYIGLFEEEVPHAIAEGFYLSFGEVLAFSDLEAEH